MLETIYEDIKNEVFQFHRVYKLIKNEGYTPIQLIEVANILDDLPLLRSEHQLLEQDNQNLRNEREQLNGSIIAAKENLSAITRIKMHTGTKESSLVPNSECL